MIRVEHIARKHLPARCQCIAKRISQFSTPEENTTRQKPGFYPHGALSINQANLCCSSDLGSWRWHLGVAWVLGDLLWYSKRKQVLQSLPGNRLLQVPQSAWYFPSCWSDCLLYRPPSLCSVSAFPFHQRSWAPPWSPHPLLWPSVGFSLYCLTQDNNSVAASSCHSLEQDPRSPTVLTPEG